MFGPDRLFGSDLHFSWTFAPGGRLSYEAYNVFTCLIYICIYIYYFIFTFTFTITLHLHLYYDFSFFFTKRNLAQYLHRSALQAPYFACAEIWSIAMFLAYQRASRPYKRLVFDDFTFLSFDMFLIICLFGVFCWGHLIFGVPSIII